MKKNKYCDSLIKNINNKKEKIKNFANNNISEDKLCKTISNIETEMLDNILNNMKNEMQENQKQKELECLEKYKKGEKISRLMMLKLRVKKLI